MPYNKLLAIKDVLMKVLVFCFLFTILSFKAFSVEKTNPNRIKILEGVALQFNAKAPVRLSKTLQIQKLTTTGREVTYHNKSSVSDVATFATNRFVKDMKAKLTEKVCKEPSQQFFRDLDVIVNYRYIDKNDKYLTTISIETRECN
jgi:hypothetical protein